jgi:predicted nucleic acid-binding protein
VSFAIDASAALALHFLDERPPFEAMEDRLAEGETAYTAPSLFQEVMEGLRRGVREKRTTAEDAAAWLTVLDAFDIQPIPLHPCAGSATWLLAEALNVSAYDAGYLAAAKGRGLDLFSRDDPLRRKSKQAGVTVIP